VSSTAAEPAGHAERGEEKKAIWSEAIRVIGGLVAVSVGLLVVLAIAVTALILAGKGSDALGTIASAAFGVVGTIVGAYFGVKVGTDGTSKAIDGMKEEASKAQAFAAHVPAENAAAAIAQAEKLIRPPSGS
jgi:hypothetical protein